jgi:hypothetical protein
VLLPNITLIFILINHLFRISPCTLSISQSVCSAVRTHYIKHLNHEKKNVKVKGSCGGALFTSIFSLKTAFASHDAVAIVFTFANRTLKHWSYILSSMLPSYCFNHGVVVYASVHVPLSPQNFNIGGHICFILLGLRCTDSV